MNYASLGAGPRRFTSAESRCGLHNYVCLSRAVASLASFVENAARHAFFCEERDIQAVARFRRAEPEVQRLGLYVTFAL